MSTRAGKLAAVPRSWRRNRRGGTYTLRRGENRAVRRDSGLPEGDLQAPGDRRSRDDDADREGDGGRTVLGDLDAEEARDPRAGRAPSLPGSEAHGGGRARRAGGDPPPPPARAVPGRDARAVDRRRACGGRPARARAVRGARGP